MNYKQYNNLALVYLVTFILPLSANATNHSNETVADKLIICGRTIDDPCDFVDLMTVLNNLIDVIIQLALAFTVIVLLMVGAKYLFAGSADKKSEAKESFAKLAKGFAFILGAWLIVNTLFLLAGVDTAFNFLN